MTIVNTTDTRNAGWATDTSSFGHRMLSKMGWSQGKGLGREQQGSSTHLRAIRRAEETLGIGAQIDKSGSLGWVEARTKFHAVLAKLNAATHCDADSSKHEKDGRRNIGENLTEAKEKKRKRKKKEKLHSKNIKRRKMKKDNEVVEEDNRRETLLSARKKSQTDTLTLAQNKVTAGHAAKMRKAKDLTTKSHDDMAAIFGMTSEEYRKSITGKKQKLKKGEAQRSQKRRTTNIKKQKKGMSKKRRKSV